MIHPILPSTDPYQELSYAQKITAYRKIMNVQCKGRILIAVAMFVFFISLAAFILGSLFLGYPQDFSNLLYEVFFSLMLPAIAAIFLITVPTCLHGFRYHQLSMKEHKLLAESNYKQLKKYSDSLESSEASEKMLIQFIEEQVILKEYNRVFSAAVLSQTILLVQKQTLENSHKDIMIRSLDKVKSSLFMNAYQKEKLARKDEREAKADKR